MMVVVAVVVVVVGHGGKSLRKMEVAARGGIQ